MRCTWDGRADEQRRAYGESKNIPQNWQAKNWAGKSQYAKATQAPKGGANANTKTWSGTGQDSDEDSFFSKAAVRERKTCHIMRAIYFIFAYSMLFSPIPTLTFTLALFNFLSLYLCITATAEV